MNSSSGYNNSSSNNRYTNNMASAPFQKQGYPSNYVADAKVSSTTVNRTAKEIENEEEEEEEDEEDNNDDNVYNEDQLKFFQDLVHGRRKLNGDDPYWEMKAELSGNLGKLFNKQAKYRGDESYWERPATYGLENSAPIIATKYNVHAKTNSLDENRMFRAEAKETGNTTSKPQTKTLYEMVQQGGVTYDSVAKNNGIRSVIDRDENISRSNNRQNVEDEGEGEDDEDYDEDGEEDEDEEEDDENVLGGLMNSTGLSPNLMALLGMEVTAAPVATDWKPPERAGLDNSDALVAKQKLRAMQNGIMTVNKN